MLSREALRRSKILKLLALVNMIVHSGEHAVDFAPHAMELKRYLSDQGLLRFPLKLSLLSLFLSNQILERVHAMENYLRYSTVDSKGRSGIVKKLCMRNKSSDSQTLFVHEGACLQNDMSHSEHQSGDDHRKTLTL